MDSYKVKTNQKHPQEPSTSSQQQRQQRPPTPAKVTTIATSSSPLSLTSTSIVSKKSPEETIVLLTSVDVDCCSKDKITNSTPPDAVVVEDIVERAQEATQELFVINQEHNQHSDNKNNHLISESLSIKELNQFKQIIGERLRKLEQLIERFKLIIENVVGMPITNLPTSKTTQSLPLESMTKSSSNSSSISTTIPKMSESVEDLRAVLTDIDQHLTVLKEIEQRNNVICESFSKEIRSRDEALLEKMKQINVMNHEMVTLQAKIQHLALKNSQLESEIKYLKTTSSFTNTETSSTPVLNDLERIHNVSEIGSIVAPSVPTTQFQQNPNQQQNLLTRTLEEKLNNEDSTTDSEPMKIASLSNKSGKQRPSSLTSKDQQIRSKRSTTTTPIVASGQEPASFDDDHQQQPQIAKQQQTTPPVLNPGSNQQHAAIYHDLMVQYRKIEQLIQQSQIYKINQDGNNSIKNDKPFEEDAKHTVLEHQDNIDEIIETRAELLTTPTPQQQQPEFLGSNGAQLKQFDSIQSGSLGTPLTTDVTGIAGINNESISEPNTPVTAILTDTARIDTATTNMLGSTMPSLDGVSGERAGGIGRDSSTALDMFIDNDDVVATSIKAYEHFVKMQHDLEILMKKENDYRSKIQELEQENQRLKQQVKDDEFNLSDVQYELDILKHNYELEIESFSTAINEREALIEKLQQKMQNLKARYIRLDEKLKTANKTEIELNAKIEELQGRLEYEQLQKKTLIDSRVSDLENKLKQQEQDYLVEVNNLKTDLVCQESICKELQTKVDELENSLKNLASAEFEDEFIYYKNQIDGLVTELDKEKQERQRSQEHYEQSLRAKDKQLEQQKEQLKKEKDSMMREKTEYEQRFRKMSTKIKSKEQEIKQLQEKISMLNEKFKSKHQHQIHGSPNEVTAEQNEPTTKSEEQLLSELALNEIKMSELNGQLEDYEERFRLMQQSLETERTRRRRLETFYLNSLNNHQDCDGNDPNGWMIIETHQQQQSPSFGCMQNGRIINQDYSQDESLLGVNHYGRRDSTSSFALLMDETGEHHRLPPTTIIDGDVIHYGYHHHLQQQQSYFQQWKRWLRRQKNILLCGHFKARIWRILLLCYFIWIHYMAIVYLFGNHGLVNKDAIATEQEILDKNSHSILTDDNVQHSPPNINDGDF